MFARFAAAGVLASALAWAQPQPPLTTIQDVLFKADGTRFNGLIQIAWTSFEGGNQTNIPQQTRTVRIIDGNLFVQLVPTTNAVPTAVYTVRYSSDGRIQFTEFWAVPPTTSRLRVRDVRTTDPQFPGGGAGGATVIQISDVVGLPEELANRPLRGPAYANARAAVIGDTGLIEGALGSPTDCVRVDGTAGPCGSGSGDTAFVDAATPTGTVDGSNNVFTLASAPNPSVSLQIYRNGALQRPGSGNDYVLSGSTITFQTGATPQTGDVLLAYYRIFSAGAPAPSFEDGENPSGVVDGSNVTFTLVGVPNPALSLQLFRNGILQRNAIDYTLSGNTIQFLAVSTPQAGDVLQAYYRR